MAVPSGRPPTATAPGPIGSPRSRTTAIAGDAGSAGSPGVARRGPHQDDPPQRRGEDGLGLTRRGAGQAAGAERAVRGAVGVQPGGREQPVVVPGHHDLAGRLDGQRVEPVHEPRHGRRRVLDRDDGQAARPERGVEVSRRGGTAGPRSRSSRRRGRGGRTTTRSSPPRRSARPGAARPPPPSRPGLSEKVSRPSPSNVGSGDPSGFNRARAKSRSTLRRSRSAELSRASPTRTIRPSGWTATPRATSFFQVPRSNGTVCQPSPLKVGSRLPSG